MSKVIRIGTKEDVWSEPSYSIDFLSSPVEFPAIGEPFVKVTNKLSGNVTWVKYSSVDFIEVKKGGEDD